MLFLCMQMLMASPVESPIRLAAQLAKDGEIARAESVLLDIDIEHQTRDVVLLHVTLGLIALKKEQPREALNNFIQARELFSEKTEGIEKDSVLVYIAQCHLMLEEPSEALSVLKEYTKDTKIVRLLHIEAYRQLKSWDIGWEYAKRAVQTWNDDIRLRQEVIFFSSKLGLVLPLQEELQFCLSSSDMKENDALRIAALLREDGHSDIALSFLDVVKHRFFSENVWRSLSILALEQGKWSHAASSLSVLSMYEPSYSLEASQAYIQSGDWEQALRYNSFAPASKEKYQQRLSILLQHKEYELAVVVQDQLGRWGAIMDDTVRYGLGYAYFQIGLYEEAKESLTGISEPKIFQQSVALQKVIQKCMVDPCY